MCDRIAGETIGGEARPRPYSAGHRGVDAPVVDQRDLIGSHVIALDMNDPVVNTRLTSNNRLQRVQTPDALVTGDGKSEPNDTDEIPCMTNPDLREEIFNVADLGQKFPLIGGVLRHRLLADDAHNPSR